MLNRHGFNGMELGLLSNMLVNRQPYWQAYIPPLFSAIAGDRTNVRILEPPPYGARKWLFSRCISPLIGD
jgi:hypothetical protein